jgi:hypothetical protein
MIAERAQIEVSLESLACESLFAEPPTADWGQ